MANAVHADLEDVRDGLLEKPTVGPFAHPVQGQNDGDVFLTGVT